MRRRKRDGALERIAAVLLVVGAGRLLAGAVGWFVIRRQLVSEDITVPGSALFLPLRPVRGPLTAFAQAEAIRGITMKATGGRVYSEMAEDDPMAAMALDSALLRSTLLNSVLAFAVAAGEVVLGAVLMALGVALRRIRAS